MSLPRASELRLCRENTQQADLRDYKYKSCNLVFEIAAFSYVVLFKEYIILQLQAELLSDLKAPTPKSGGRVNTL